MEWNEKPNHYRLTSGREIYANRGILGLGLASDDTLYEGYDGHITDADEYDDGRLTPAERRQIADQMIARWQAWAAKK